jgi:large subunit ribosomal protein L16
MLQPKRVKYRKTHKGRRSGAAHSGNTLAFGDYGLQAVGSAWMTARQIEAARRAIVRYMKRDGKIWIRIFPDKPVTTKPAEVRMGGGKGATDYWVAVIKRDRVLFEVAGVSFDTAKEAMRLASYKLPFKTKFISKVDPNHAKVTEEAEAEEVAE